jgi:hypothetical protein
MLTHEGYYRHDDVLWSALLDPTAFKITVDDFGNLWLWLLQLYRLRV